MQRLLTALALGSLVCLAADVALAVIVVPSTANPSGNGNTTATSLTAAGGPAVSAAGFANVGTSSTGQASVIYLANGWALSAAHVTIDNSVGPIHFGGNAYDIDMSSVQQLRNADGKLADLQLFRLTTVPILPAIDSSLISNVVPGGRQIMIGNGANIGAQRYWHVDTTQSPWQWQEQSAPASPGNGDYSGYNVVAGNTIRWGENDVWQTGVVREDFTIKTVGYTTRLDGAGYTSGTPRSSEAQGSGGDSGGAVFSMVDGRWKLTGLMVGISGLYSGQPASTSILGDMTFIADLSQYRSQIVAVVPEPGAATSAAMALAMWVASIVRRHARRPSQSKPVPDRDK